MSTADLNRITRRFALWGGILLLLSGLATAWFWTPAPPAIGKADLSHALGGYLMEDRYPTEIDWQKKDNETPERLTVQYSVDLRQQEDIRRLIESYKPDYAAFVAIDAITGRVLTLVNFTKNGFKKADLPENLSLQARFPAASIFKVVTAAAALEENKASPETVIPFNGASHTLYRRNVVHDQRNRWTRFITMREAFAQSINTVFGKLGLFFVGPELLQAYAERFGFNRAIPADFPLEVGKALIPSENQWGLAEAASGFTRMNTMSPVQGALIGAAAANDGVVMEPYLVETLHTEDGTVIYRPELKTASVAMSPQTAAEMRELMQATVRRGTSRGSFRGFNRRFPEVEVGGKTGTLSSLNPRGRTDWFVGYARDGSRRVAFAALTIHEKYWTVKSAYLVRRFLENYFKENPLDSHAKAPPQPSAAPPSI